MAAVHASKMPHAHIAAKTLQYAPNVSGNLINRKKSTKMQKSVNTLVIKEINGQHDNEYMCFGDAIVIPPFVCELKAEIWMVCPVTGNHFATIEITARGSAAYDLDAARVAIQNFLSGNLHCRLSLSASGSDCELDRESITGLVILVGEPWQGLFNELFNQSKWVIPKRICDAASLQNNF